MVSIYYDEKYKLIDEDYLEENIESILLSTNYIPFILRGIIEEIYVDPTIYKKWRIHESENDKGFASKQKIVFMDYARVEVNGEKGTGALFHILELLIFLEIHPEYYGMIKDEKYLTELVDECEKEYDIDVMDYINDYEDLKKLLKKLKEDS